MNTNALLLDEIDPDPSTDEQHAVSILSGIYLEVGLPLYAAVRAAIADYECAFGEPVLCLS